jgi:hypothetical protein
VELRLAERAVLPEGNPQTGLRAIRRQSYRVLSSTWTATSDGSMTMPLFSTSRALAEARTRETAKRAFPVCAEIGWSFDRLAMALR